MISPFVPCPIAIPSYKRASVLKEKTLAFLQREHVSASVIYIFVANQEEFDEYTRVLEPTSYNRIIIGKPGLAAQRNFISRHFAEGEIILQMDDDVKGIKRLYGTFNQLLYNMYDELKNDCGLVGILPNDDGRRMFSEKTYHLTFIIGCFLMVRNHRDFYLHHDEKDDFVRSIWYFQKYGRVCRLQHAGVITTYNIGSGGLIGPHREQKMKEGIEFMLKEYPGYCRLVKKRKGLDIILNWRASPSVESRVLSPEEVAPASEPSPS
jgi:hypothetical protein